jgi:hypothetical protein
MDFRDIGIGAGQGVDKGLNTLGAVQGLWNKQKEQEHLDKTRPIQEKMLENQGFIQQLNVDKVKQEQEFLNSPVDIKSHPQVASFYGVATPEEKLIFDSRIAKVPQTNQGLKLLVGMLNTDEDLAKATTASGGRILAGQLANFAGALEQKHNAFRSMPDTDPRKAQLKTEIDADRIKMTQLENAGNAYMGKATKAVNSVKIHNIIMDNKDVISKDKGLKLAAQYATETGNVESFNKAITAYKKNPYGQLGFYLEKNGGDYDAALEDWTNTKKDIKAAPGAGKEKPVKADKTAAMKALDKIIEGNDEALLASPEGSDTSNIIKQKNNAIYWKNYLLRGGDPTKIPWPNGQAQQPANDYSALVTEAKAAIAKGADPVKVKARLKEKGYNGSI